MEKKSCYLCGKYEVITLAEAREARDIAKRHIAKGIDPSQAKKQAKVERVAALANTFQAVATQWHAANLHRWKPNHAERVWRYFKTDVLPLIGSLSLSEVNVAAVKALLDRITIRGSVATTEKVRQWVGAVFEFAAMLELTDRTSGYT